MGYDIGLVNDENICIHTYMGAFRMLSEQGYNWFKLIDAEKYDSGISGTGETGSISVDKIKNALDVLKKIKCDRLSSEGRDEFTYRKPILIKFMKSCLDYAKKNNLETIDIYFG